MNEQDLNVSLAMVEKIQKDVIALLIENEDGSLVSAQDIRAIVDLYYQIQDFRIATANQTRERTSAYFADWINKQLQVLEDQMKCVLETWSERDPTAKWARSVKGIGPVIATSLSAFIDIEKAKTVSALWRFSGQDPSMKWIGRKKARKIVVRMEENFKSPKDAIPAIAKETKFSIDALERFAKVYGEGKITWDSLEKAASRCPWNAKLKTLIWKIGDSFVKSSNKGSYFGEQIYRKRKILEHERDANGEHAQIAAEALNEHRFKDATVIATYKKGKLPLGRLELRARRKAQKLFLSLWWEVAFRNHFGKEPPIPYSIAILGHAKKITVEEVMAYEEAREAELEEEKRKKVG
jgi:hypothetical protein